MKGAHITMARFEDTPDLFGVGGMSTGFRIECDWCGTIHNKDVPEDATPSQEGRSVCYTSFGGKQICDCCFEDVENAVASRLTTIIPWFTRMIEAKAEQVVDLQEIVNNLKKALARKEVTTQ